MPRSKPLAKLSACPTPGLTQACALPKVNAESSAIEQEYEMAHQRYNACIEACNECAIACNHCATACLREDNVKAMARCIALDTDCAAICQLASAAMARGSEQSQAICTLCADICEACGKECGKHSMDHCQQCAQACRDCAAACRKMASTSTAFTLGKGYAAHDH